MWGAGPLAHLTAFSSPRGGGKAQQRCEGCDNLFGEYYCDICHLFDRDKKQYHCGECGICRCLGGGGGGGEGRRVGGGEGGRRHRLRPDAFLLRIGPKEDFFHCSKCNLCLSLSLRGKHKVRTHRLTPYLEKKPK